MKKLVKMIIVLLLALSLTGLVACKKTEDNGVSDYAAIEKRGTIKIGYTVFAPIAYPDANNELIGFDVDLPKAVAAKLGLTAEFVLIDWDTKEAELEAKTIDCIWNGLTITDERQENLSLTPSYMKNQQVVITLADKTYTDIASLSQCKIGAEAGSAGEDAIKDNNMGKEYVALNAQSDILTELLAGTIDAGVMDSVMAAYYVGQTADGSKYKIVDSIQFDLEYYGIACRKSSPYIAAKIWNAIVELKEDGTVDTIADKYDLKSQLAITAGKIDLTQYTK